MNYNTSQLPVTTLALALWATGHYPPDGTGDFTFNVTHAGCDSVIEQRTLEYLCGRVNTVLAFLLVPERIGDSMGEILRIRKEP